MTIKNKLDKVIKDKKYNFIGIDFDIYKYDRFRIYDKRDGSCLYDGEIDQINLAPRDLLIKEYRDEELWRLEDRSSTGHRLFCIAFYIDAPDIIEKPINAGVRFV